MCIELFLGNLFGRVVYVCHISSNITLPIVVLTMTQCETDMVMWHFLIIGNGVVMFHITLFMLQHSRHYNCANGYNCLKCTFSFLKSSTII